MQIGTQKQYKQLEAIAKGLYAVEKQLKLLVKEDEIHTLAQTLRLVASARKEFFRQVL